MNSKLTANAGRRQCAEKNRAESQISVTAVVVTFNRKEFLSECLDGLLRQTHPVGHIVIIDNASTDGTAEFLSTAGYLKLDKIEYIRLATNTGGAGGFHEGVKHAYEYGAEWIWMMDDDVEPVPNALQTMLSYSDRSGCIQGDKGYLDGRREQWERAADLRRSGRRKRLAILPDTECVSVKVGCFEGMLIRREIVSKIGYPDGRFFIGGDDVAYGYLASKHTAIIYLPRICFIKKIVKISAVQPTLLSRIRTRFTSHHSSRFYFFVVRNELLLFPYIRDGVNSFLFFLRVGGVLMRYTLVSLICERDLKNCSELWRGAREGWRLQASKSVERS